MITLYAEARRRARLMLKRHTTTPLVKRYACTERIVSGQAVESMLALVRGHPSQVVLRMFMEEFLDDVMRHTPAITPEQLEGRLRGWIDSYVQSQSVVIKEELIGSELKRALWRRSQGLKHDGCHHDQKQKQLVRYGACFHPGYCEKGIRNVGPNNPALTTFSARLWLLECTRDVIEAVAKLDNAFQSIVGADSEVIGPITVYRGRVGKGAADRGVSARANREHLSIGIDLGLLGAPDLFTKPKAFISRDSCFELEELWVPNGIYPHLNAELHNWFMGLITYLRRSDTPMFKERTRIGRWKRSKRRLPKKHGRLLQGARLLHGTKGTPMGRATPFIATLLALSQYERIERIGEPLTTEDVKHAKWLLSGLLSGTRGKCRWEAGKAVYSGVVGEW